MKKNILTARYERINMEHKKIEEAIQSVLHFENYIQKDIDDSTIDDIKKYAKHLIEIKENTYQNVIHLARYYYYIDKKDHYIHMTKYFNSHEVMDSMIKRVGEIAGAEKKLEIELESNIPPFLTDTKEFPEYTKKFLEVLQKHLDEDVCHHVLAGNHHQIPSSAFDQEKEFYKESSSLATYLKERHQRKVDELKEYYNQNQIWFEQKITKEVLEYVAGNQEILSGKIEGDTLFITKIPYNTKNYLEHEGNLKHYYACHCSFVRENLKENNYDVPVSWCSCSAGFAKYPFETILEHELPIKVINSPLQGDDYCRFAIDLKDINYKK